MYCFHALSFQCDNSTTVCPIFTILHMYVDIDRGKTPIGSEIGQPKVKVTVAKMKICPHFSDSSSAVAFCFTKNFLVYQI